MANLSKHKVLFEQRLVSNKIYDIRWEDIEEV